MYVYMFVGLWCKIVFLDQKSSQASVVKLHWQIKAQINLKKKKKKRKKRKATSSYFMTKPESLAPTPKNTLFPNRVWGSPLWWVHGCRGMDRMTCRSLLHSWASLSSNLPAPCCHAPGGWQWGWHQLGWGWALASSWWCFFQELHTHLPPWLWQLLHLQLGHDGEGPPFSQPGNWVR